MGTVLCVLLMPASSGFVHRVFVENAFRNGGPLSLCGCCGKVSCASNAAHTDHVKP